MVLMKRSSAAATALFLTAFAVFFLVPRLNETMNRIVSAGIGELRTRLEGALGLSLSFDSMSPSLLSAASLSQFAVSAPDGRVLLSARRVRAHYSILAVLRGKSSETLTGLELEDVRLDIRLPRDRAIVDRIRALLVGGEGGGELAKIVVTGSNVTASVALEGLGTAIFDAREVGFSTVKSEPAISLQGKFSLYPSGGGFGRVSGPLSLSGSLSRDFKNARLGLAIAADSREFSLSTQRFELVYGAGRLSLTKVRDRAPLDAEISVDFGGGDSSVSLRLEEFVPSRSLRLLGRYAYLEPWLEIPYSGSLAVKAPGFDFAKLGYELHLAGALPGHLLPADSPAVSVDIAARGDSRSVSVDRARVERGADTLEYSGSFRFGDLSPDGTLDLSLSLMDGALDFSSAMRIVGNGGEYAALADQATIGGVVFKDVALAAARKGSLVDFNLSFRPPAPTEAGSEPAATQFSGEAGAESGMSLVRCEGALSLGESPGLELSVDLETIDLEPIQPLLALLSDSPEAASLFSSLKLGGALFATSDFKKLSWSAPDLTVVSRSLPGAYALLSLSGTARSVAVKHALVSAYGLSVEGSGKVDFSQAGQLGFEASISLKDIPFAVTGVVLRQGVSLTGDYGLELSARSEGANTYVSAKARGLPLPIDGGLFLATVAAEGRYATLEDWSISVAELDVVPTGEKMAALPKVGLSGVFGPSSASLSSLRVEDKFSAVSGKASLDYSLAAPYSARISARLAAAGEAKSSAPPESYIVDAAFSGQSVDGTVDLVASPLARLGKLPVAGSADGRIAVKGELSAPNVDFRLRLRDGKYLDQTLALGASGSYGAAGIELRDVSAAYQGQSISRGTARFSFEDASATVALAFSGTLADEVVKFSLTAQGQSTMRTGGSLAERLASYRAKGLVSDFSFGLIRQAAWPFDAASSSGTVNLVGGSSGELRFKYSSPGSFSGNLRAPFPVVADVSGLFDGKNIDLSVQGVSFDLGLLSPLMPPELIKILSGKARGGFRAIGLASDPEISGEIDLEGASLKVLGWLADDVGPFNASITAMGRKIAASAPSAKVGKSSIAAEAQATFDHWVPTGFTASVKTLDKSRVSLDTTLLGIRASGEATAGLKFALQGDVLALDCDVTLYKGTTVVVSPAVLDQQGAGPGRPSLFLAVAANVRFGRGVQVFFPSKDFPVIAGYSDPSSLLAIRYDQASEDFTLKGGVALRGGQVFYIQRNFFLKSGKIVFNEGTNRFEPRVTLLAELRDRNDDGPVLITLRADNAPISTFQPRLSSDPVMTESQIAMLMGQNLFGASSDSRLDPLKAVISGSEFIPQLNVTRLFEDKVRDVMGLDIFYIRTRVLQNWLIDFSAQAESSRSNTMGRYLDQTEFYAGKYISDSIFAHGSTRLREDPLAGANKLGIDSELGVELDTPFGLVQWNVTPKNWDNLLINDQSLSISWRLSL